VNATSASPADARAGAPHADAASRNPAASLLDAPTRAFHWLMALSAFWGPIITADGERFRMVHVTLGYTLVGLVGWRVLWGLAGPAAGAAGRLAGQAARSARRGGCHQGRAVPLQAGQNVLQAAAVLGLLVAGVLVTATGYALFAEAGRRPLGRRAGRSA
jgi:cytochrome b